MGFSSKLYPNEVILDDSTTEGQLEDMAKDQGRGLVFPEGRMAQDYAYEGAADPFPAELEVPESEWEPRVKEMEERKTRTSDLIRVANLPHKDQSNTNFCWINAPTYAMEGTRVIQGQPMEILSPASAGSVITGFRNVGGWGKNGLQFIASRGVVPVRLWPANAIDQRYDTPEAWEAAKAFICQKWYEAKPRNFKQHFSMLLRRMMCPVGLNYWSHEVTDEDPIFLDGEPCVRFRNSWKGFGDNGYAVRRGSKKYADDIVAPVLAVGG